jgi:hypothetical protein
MQTVTPAVVVALLVGAIAASGRFSLNTTNILLFIAWAGRVLAITQAGLRDRHTRIAAELWVGVVDQLLGNSAPPEGFRLQ